MRQLALFAIVIVPVFSTGAAGAFAQSPADEFSRRQAQEERLQRLDALGAQTPGAASPTTPASAAPPGSGGPCFVVERVAVEGVRIIPGEEIETVTEPYAGRCVGITQIDDLLRKITHLYLDRGFIASRAYVPEQDIAATRALRLVVVEGSLSEIYLNGKPAPDSRLLKTAFPGVAGRPANIRDIEQGLDQINRLPSSKATTEMLPGPDEGTSILDVDIERSRPWHVSLGNNNLGQKQTGTSKSAFSFRQDNLFELNDLTSFTYEHTGPDYPGDSDGWGESDSYSGSFAVPYGYWTFTTNGSWYEYTSSVPGSFSDLETSGTSGQVGAVLERVVRRGKSSLTQLRGGLNYKETDNFLLGNRIEVGSRRYSVGSLGLSHSRRMLGGLWIFDVAADQGLDLFGAVEPGAPGAGDADPAFTKFSATITAILPFEIQGQQFELSSLLNGQYSPDNLFGAEQMSLGGYSNVRGTRESVLFGNNGFFSRNEITWCVIPWRESRGASELLGELRPYLGLDYGRTFEQARDRIDGGDMLSWTVGARLVGGRFNLDLGYSAARADGHEKADAGLFFVSTSVRW
jgi:hemolysin activation/secretion protein